MDAARSRPRACKVHIMAHHDRPPTVQKLQWMQHAHGRAGPRSFAQVFFFYCHTTPSQEGRTLEEEGHYYLNARRCVDQWQWCQQTVAVAVYQLIDMGRARSTTPQRPRSSTSQRSEFSCLAPRAGSTTTGDHDQAQAAAGGILNVTPDTRAATVLHTADEVPEHLREPFISAGYRVNLTWSQCLLSLFRWHNQTLNIWTHLPFTIVCVILCLRLSSHVDVLRPTNSSWPTQSLASSYCGDAFKTRVSLWPFGVYAVAWAVCFACSSSFHLFGTAMLRKDLYFGFKRIDFVGVTICGWGTIFIANYYAA